MPLARCDKPVQPTSMVGFFDNVLALLDTDGSESFIISIADRHRCVVPTNGKRSSVPRERPCSEGLDLPLVIRLAKTILSSTKSCLE